MPFSPGSGFRSGQRTRPGWLKGAPVVDEPRARQGGALGVTLVSARPVSSSLRIRTQVREQLRGGLGWEKVPEIGQEGAV